MNVKDLFWPDSILLSIEMEYDALCILIHNEVLKKKLRIRCSGVVGVSSIVLWDDIIINNIFQSTIEESDTFLQKLIQVYGKYTDCGGRSLSDVHHKLNIELVSGFSFSVYCQDVYICEDDAGRMP